MLNDQPVLKPKLRVNDIAHLATGISVSVLVDETYTALQVICVNDLELRPDITTLTDHVPHSVNALLSSQVKRDVVKGRRWMIA